MATAIKIPRTNPLRFYASGNSLEDIAVSYEQTVKTYCQRFTKSMFLNFQVHVLTGSYDAFTCDVEQLHEDDTITTEMELAATAVTIVGSSYEYDVITARGLYSSTYDILAELPVGVYRLNMTFEMKTIDDKQFYTEWFEIVDSVSDCLLFNYSHNENDYDTAFQLNADGSSPQSFQFLVEGGLWSQDFTPIAKDTAYTDQLHDVVLLKSIPYNTMKLTFGTAKGFPNWIADRINRIFSLDTVLINNLQYCKAEGARMEAVAVDRYPYRAWTLEVQEPETKYSDEYDATAGMGDFNDDFNTDFF